MSVAGLHFLRPEWLWLALPALLLGSLLWRQWGQSGNWGSIISSELIPYLLGREAGGKRRNPLPLLILAWLVAVLAVAGPSWEKLPQPIHQKQDALVLVLDLSYSMKAEDLQPSRLDRARQKLLDLLALRKEGQTALVAYAGDAHIVSPLTDDNPTIANLVPALSPDIMPLPGSEPLAAMELAVQLLRSAGIRGGQILLLTDGVSASETRAISELLQDNGVRLNILGLGTDSGAPIPLPRGGFLNDRQGDIVIPRLERAPLQQLAASTGGFYSDLRLDDADLAAVINSGGLSTATETLALDRAADSWDDKGYLLALLLLPLCLALFRRGWLLCLAPIVLAVQPADSHAQSWQDLWLTPDQQGQRALQAGDAATAAELFENPEWAGLAAYEAGDYDSAGQHFSHSDSADSWYNRGNALARQGELDAALAAYRKSLELAPGQADAEHNIELLEQLKQQQEQQEQQQQQQGQQQEQQQQQEQNQQPNEQQQQPADNPQDGSGASDAQQGPEQAGDRQHSEQPEQGDAETNEEQSPPAAQQPQQKPQQEQAEPQDPGEQQSADAAAQTQMSPEEREKQQAMEQWLRRVPDDPAGLLREKFRYESRQRQQLGEQSESEKYW